MFPSSLYVVLRAKHNIWADHQDVLSPDLFSHGSRSSTSRSDLLKLPIYVLKTRTKKHEQTDVLLYVNDGCDLNNYYSRKCNRQQKKYCVSRTKPKTQNWDRTGSRIGSQKKKCFKEKYIQNVQIVYKIIIIIKNKSGKLKYVK